MATMPSDWLKTLKYPPLGEMKQNLSQVFLGWFPFKSVAVGPIKYCIIKPLQHYTNFPTSDLNNSTEVTF